MLKYFTVWLILLTVNAAYSNNIHSQWKLKHITVDQGLSNNFVHSICQDKNGYLWFASSYGLNKYNGTSIQKFFQENTNSTSLNSNYTPSLCMHSDSTLWIGTDKGLFIYNDTTENFISIPIPDNQTKREIFVITEDHKHQLLIGTSTGLFTINPQNKQVNKIDLRAMGVAHDSIFCLIPDKENNLWMTSFKQGLYYFNRKTNTIRHFKAVKEDINSLPDNHIFTLFIDKNEALWIGTYNHGICKFNKHDTSFTRYVIDPNDEFTKRIRTIFEDRYGRLFFGSRDGLFIFNRQTEDFDLYAHNTHKVSQLSQNSVTCSFTDNQGGVWLGTHSGGVNYINMYEKNFGHYRFIENDPLFLNTGAVHCFAETSDKLYVGTEKGINLLDKATGTFKYLKNIPGNSNSLSYDDVKDIAIKDENNIWVATNRGGIQVWDQNNNVVKAFLHQADDPHSLPSNNVYNVFCDAKKRIWVITNSDWDREQAVVSRYNPKENSFTTYPNNFFMGFYQGEDGALLAGGYYGFYRYDEESDSFISYKNDSLILRAMTVLQDKKENIWVGSRIGLTRYNKSSGQFEDFSSKVPIKFEEVFGLIEHDSNLWVSTNNGLLIIKQIYSDNNQYPIQYYDKNDGLQSREFNYNAYYVGKDGSFYFGGDNGFNHFHPDEIRKNPFMPKVYLSALSVAGNNVEINDTVKGDVLLNKSLKYTRKITLGYNTGALRISFDIIHYANTNANSFKYILKGQNDQWSHTAATHNSVTYYKLQPGKYKFIVYGINSDGVQSKSPASIDIVITPPFIQTLGFKLGSGLLLTLLIFLTMQFRVNYLKRQRAKLRQTVEEKTSDLLTKNKYLNEIQKEILNQNEEIKTQRDTIQSKNYMLEELFQKAIKLHEFGDELTLTLDINKVINAMYSRLTSLFQVSLFGIGIRNGNNLAFKHIIENGEKLPPVKIDFNQTKHPAGMAFRNNQVINANPDNLHANTPELHQNINPKSFIYVPLSVKNKIIGVITLQSEKENAYDESDIPIVKSIATFIAIAYDNSKAYSLIENQNKALDKHRTNLEEIVEKRTEELEKEKEKAVESDRLKSAFLANMSHEIRTPLNAIIGFINILNHMNSNPEHEAYFNIIQKSSFTLLKLIEDIIDFSKIESGIIDIHLEKIHINNQLKDLLTRFQRNLKEHNDTTNQEVSLSLENRTTYNDTILADQQLLDQIFSNLISNAIKFTHKGSIKFGLHTVKDKLLTFYIKDTGIGITQENFDYIFKRFRKLENQTDRLYRGGGLGLSIVKNLTELLDGNVWLQSEPEKGSTFYFSITDKSDANKEISSRQKQVRNARIVPNWKDFTVLIVEDEVSNLHLLKTYLKPTQITVLHAKDGVEGVALFTENQAKIDMVLMDIKLPLMSGYEASEKIKSLSPNTPIIAQTAFATTSDKIKLEQSVMDDFVTKPIHNHTLISKMLHFLEKQ